MKIYFRNKQDLIPVDWRTVKKLAGLVIDEENRGEAELGILIVDNKRISRLNRKYFGEQSPTDVIAFPMNSGPGTGYSPDLLGDVVVSAEKAVEYASKRNLDLYKELSLYVIHGVLHLLGYDDIRKVRRSKMLRQQRRLLNLADREGLLISSGD